MSETLSILGGFILPHPPIIIPEIGKTDRAAILTINSMNAVAEDIAKLKPDTIVFISPHAPLFSDYVFLYDHSTLEGDLGKFGAPEVKFSGQQDTELLYLIAKKFHESGVPGGSLSEFERKRNAIDQGLDHGITVPLWFIRQKCENFKMIAMSCSGLDLPKVYKAGAAIAKAAGELGRRTVVVASGDMSHKVNEKSPYGASVEGPVFDGLVCDHIKAADLPALLSIDHEIREGAAECGYRSIVMLCGVYNKIRVRTKFYSYEAPYGIGYCVASFQNDPAAAGKPAPDAMENALEGHRKKSAVKAYTASPHVAIARETLEEYVRYGNMRKASDFTQFKDLPELFAKRAGVFVSLKKFGELRGCIGTTAPTTGSVAEEIVRNAISAGTQDPRFSPVETDELEYLTYSVDVLEASKPIASRAELDPAIYGVIVRKGSHSGLLLPDLEGVNTVDRQLEIACRKAGIDPASEFAIEKFKVTRYK